MFYKKVSFCKIFTGTVVASYLYSKCKQNFKNHSLIQRVDCEFYQVDVIDLSSHCTLNCVQKPNS